MNRLVHVPLNFCASKEDEIRNRKDKEDRLLSVDATGQIHIKNATIKVEADLSSDLLVRFALTRRRLALEQAGLLSYSLHEKWAEKLINSRYRELPTGYARVSTQQILQADKQAFIVAADMCRAGVQLEAAGRALDEVWDSVITRAEFHLLRPLDAGAIFCIRYVKLISVDRVGCAPQATDGSLSQTQVLELVKTLQSWAPVLLQDRDEGHEGRERKLELLGAVRWLLNVRAALPGDSDVLPSRSVVYDSMFLVRCLLMSRLMPAYVSWKEVCIHSLQLLFPDLLKDSLKYLLESKHLFPGEGSKRKMRLVLDVALLLWKRKKEQQEGPFESICRS